VVAEFSECSVFRIADDLLFELPHPTISCHDIVCYTR
jgi:hypothetical protein